MVCRTIQFPCVISVCYSILGVNEIGIEFIGSVILGPKTQIVVVLYPLIGFYNGAEVLAQIVLLGILVIIIILILQFNVYFVRVITLKAPLAVFVVGRKITIFIC